MKRRMMSSRDMGDDEVESGDEMRESERRRRQIAGGIMSSPTLSARKKSLE